MAEQLTETLPPLCCTWQPLQSPLVVVWPLTTLTLQLLLEMVLPGVVVGAVGAVGVVGAAGVAGVATLASPAVLLHKCRLGSPAVKHRNSGSDTQLLASAPQGLDDKMALQRVLSLVKEEDARIAVYYSIDGMAQIKIATLLDVPERTISTHLERFRQRARKLLQGHTEVDAEDQP